MKCPTCGNKEAVVLINNVQDDTVFCPGCAPPGFSIHGILTLADLDFMKQCGIDPGLPDVLKAIAKLTA